MGRRNSLLVINEESVKKLIRMDEAIEVIEKALLVYVQGNYSQPERVFSQVEHENYLLLMPCYVDNYIGLKVVTSFSSNRNTNIPVTQAMVLVHDIQTGEPLAIINGTLLTAIKTAAVSGVAIKYLRSEATSIGLVGTGLQGLYQLQAAISVTSAGTIYLYNRSPDKVQAFIERFKELADKDIEIISVSDIKELISKSEIIITATTSLTPVLPNEEIYDNKLIVGVGSYKENMRELPENLFRSAARFYIDSLDGRKECGDIIDPLKNGWIAEEDVKLLSDVVSNNEVISKQIAPIVFKNVSMALFDACIGNFVYEKAKREGYGTRVSF